MRKTINSKGIYIENERMKRYALDKQTWKIKDFIYGICDVKVYRHLKQGGFVKKSEIYNQLFKKLNLVYLDHEEIMEKIRKQGIILFHAYTQMDIMTYLHGLYELKEGLIEVKENVPFNTYDHFIKNLIDLVEVGKHINLAEFNEYLRIIGVFPYEYQCLMKNAMIEFALNSDQVKEYYEKIPLVDEKAIFILLQEVVYLDLVGNKLEAFELAKQLLERNKQEENINCLVYSYSHVQCLYLFMTGKKDEALIEEMKPYLNYESLQLKCLIDYYMNEAVMGIMSKSYVQAFYYLKKALSIDDPYAEGNYYRAMVLLNYINILEFVEKVEYDEPEPVSHSFSSFVCFYRYFKMKAEGTSFKELEVYLVNEVAKYVNEDAALDYEIFTKEIKSCIKETRDYKILNQWMEKTKKSRLEIGPSLV